MLHLLARRESGLRPILTLLGIAVVLASPPAASASKGAVYTETNQPTNEVVVLSRDGHGALKEVQRIGTGGMGSLQNPPFPQDHLDAVNEIELTDSGKLLFAVNAGDNTISSFRVANNGRLTLADQATTIGDHPVSVDSYGGLVYVLNELDQSGRDLTGFRYDGAGKLTPIPNSTRALATPFAADNGFGFPSPLAEQVLFGPDGKTLSIPERTSNGFHGQIDVFPVLADGTTGPIKANPSNDFIPFGLAWDKRDHLIVANGGSPLVTPMFQGSGSSYSHTGTTLTPISLVKSHAEGTCWLSITKNGKFVYMSDQNTAEISRFRIAKNGRLTLLDNVPTTGPSSDTALSADSRFFYVINVLDANGSHGATIDRYRVRGNGYLRYLGTTDAGIPDSASGLAAR